MAIVSHESLSALFAFFHHAAAFTLFASLVVERILTKGDLTVDNARRILTADLMFGIAAGVVLIIGMLRVGFFEKGPEYYWHSATFIAKFTLFVVVGLLSIYPTVEFLRWRKPLREGRLPGVAEAKMRAIRLIVRMELGGVALIVLMAAMMARGIGYFG